MRSTLAGPRGPSLLEDFILREKITHFDHERIPERVVHAHGAAAHGFFQVYKPLGRLTRTAFLHDPAKKTPVFVRFSTVVGSRGSTDLGRDVRGFAVKFYTEEGNFDLVGNNIPVFFIQDAVSFPDLIHAVKSEPHHEIPQAASAHDTFWDFISLMPESMHMIMWVNAKAPARPSPALTMANTVKDTAKTRKVAILGADGVDEGAVAAMSRLLIAAGAVPKVAGPRLGALKGAAR